MNPLLVLKNKSMIPNTLKTMDVCVISNHSVTNNLYTWKVDKVSKDLCSRAWLKSSSSPLKYSDIVYYKILQNTQCLLQVTGDDLDMLCPPAPQSVLPVPFLPFTGQGGQGGQNGEMVIECQLSQSCDINLVVEYQTFYKPMDLPSTYDYWAIEKCVYNKQDSYILPSSFIKEKTYQLFIYCKNSQVIDPLQSIKVSFDSQTLPEKSLVQWSFFDKTLYDLPINEHVYTYTFAPYRLILNSNHVFAKKQVYDDAWLDLRVMDQFLLNVEWNQNANTDIEFHVGIVYSTSFNLC